MTIIWVIPNWRFVLLKQRNQVFGAHLGDSCCSASSSTEGEALRLDGLAEPDTGVPRLGTSQ
jgi:hypothetical protein